MKKLNNVAAKARYLENLSFLGMRKSDDLYIEQSSSKFVDQVPILELVVVLDSEPPHWLTIAKSRIPVSIKL